MSVTSAGCSCGGRAPLPLRAGSILVLLGLGACYRGLPPPEPPLDATLERSADATGDGEPDRIVLHLEALSSYAPVHWQLEVESRGAIVFRYASDDTVLDPIFGETARFENCKSYLECKRSYYTQRILAEVVGPAPADWDDVSFDPDDPGSVRSVAHTYLVEECGKSDVAAAHIVSDLVETLRSGKGVLLHVPKTPFESLPPMIYAKDAGRFVPISGS
jgi:hypothetical protein